jgi:hypothetical protein
VGVARGIGTGYLRGTAAEKEVEGFAGQLGDGRKLGCVRLRLPGLPIADRLLGDIGRRRYGRDGAVPKLGASAAESVGAEACGVHHEWRYTRVQNGTQDILQDFFAGVHKCYGPNGMDERELRARRLKEAVDAYKARTGGSLRGLAAASGLAPGSIYKSMKSGTGIGRTMAARMAPHLGVSVGYLLGTDDAADLSPGGARKMKERTWVAWWWSLPEDVWPELKRIGDALAAGHRASRAGKARAGGKSGTGKSSPRTAPKRGAER